MYWSADSFTCLVGVWGNNWETTFNIIFVFKILSELSHEIDKEEKVLSEVSTYFEYVFFI